MLDLGTLSLKIKVDGVEDTQSKLQGVSSVASTAAGGLKKSLAVISKAMLATVAAAGTALIATTKKALDNYAEYEQLVGGVETLFKDSSAKVQEYANQAYQTAGMSANKYMETVTGFSASLLQSLGGDTAAAAEYGNQAVIDMSDNANKMGTSMESIQNAYQGFAKQNYTMLDNLKLGYGGTKEEMERLVSDANRVKEANGEMADLSIDSFADVTEAIHIIQTEMGITGTTSEEAASTISGSVGMVKASWSNLLTGMADENANLDALIQQFVDSVTTASKNIMPVITQALAGAGQVIGTLLPMIMEQIPAFITSYLPQMAQCGVDIINAIITGFSSNPEGLINAIVMSVGILGQGIISCFPQLLEAGFQILMALMQGLTQNADAVIQGILMVMQMIVQFLIANLPQIVSAGMDLIFALATGIANNIPQILLVIGQAILAMIVTIGQNLPQFIQQGWQLFNAICEGMAQAIAGVLIWIAGGIESMIQTIAGKVSGWIQAGKDLLKGLWDGFKEIWESVKSWIPEKIDEMKEKFKAGKDKLKEAGKAVINGFKDGLTAAWDKVVGWVNSSVDWIKSKFQGAKDEATSSPKDGGHRNGLREVPFDGYMAELHRGEMVLTAAEANRYQKGTTDKGTVNNLTVNNYSPRALDEAESARQFRRTQRELALGF